MKHEGQKHKFPKLITGGIYIHKPHPYMCATLENIFTCACCENVCVEYKCSYSIRGEDIVQGWNKTSFLELKRNHNYYAPIQGQTAITGNKRTYFVAWTGMGTPFIESIVYDPEYWKKVRSSVMRFFKVYVRSTLIGFKKLYTCPICSKPGLYDGECETNRSVKCKRCLMFYHPACARDA